MNPTIRVIVGATASGKSAAALSLAQKIGGVIINADSQQVYADLPILTARPTPEEEATVPHKLYGIMNYDENCSAGKWLRLAKMEIDWARAEGKSPIIVGGTGLYIKSLTKGIAEMPAIDESVRSQAITDYENMGKEAFCARLREIDPEFFVRLAVWDRQRLIRAYEVWLGSGKPLSWWQRREVQPTYPENEIEIINIELPRAELYANCDKRVLQMVEMGAIEEVQNLLTILPATSHQPPTTNFPIMKIIGAREFAAYLNGEISKQEAIEQCQTATRKYAKRQLTWFRHQLPSSFLRRQESL